MFRDLKEYQDIIQIYNDSVNISEEQRRFNRLFDEQEFTEEEISYISENFDEVVSILTDELTEEYHTLTEETLSEEDYLDIHEVVGGLIARKLAVKTAKKLSPAIRKGVKTVGTGLKDIGGGVKKTAGSALKKLGGALKGAGKFAAKMVPGVALGAGLVGGINALRKKGKAEREAGKAALDAKIKQGIKDSGMAAGTGTAMTMQGIKDASYNRGVKAAQDKAKAEKGGDKAGEAGAQVLKDKTKQPKATETEKPKKMHPIEKKNRARFGDEKVDKLKSKQTDFKAMKKGTMSKDDFIKKYPKSITAQKAAGLRDHTEWDAYDMVLEYLYSTEQVDSIEEANYVMMEMDQETIGSIVSEVKYVLDEGFVDNLKAGFKKVKEVAGNVKDTAVKTTKKVVSKGKDILSSKNKVKTLNPLSKENKRIREKEASKTSENKGKVDAQVSALKRKRDGKSIADVKAENEAKMRAAAKERNKKFKAK